MPEPSALRLFVARLSAAEKQAVLGHDRVFVNANLFATLSAAIEDVCLDRLVRAERLLKLARALAENSDEEELRNAIGRAYYSIHHSLRAMALWTNKWDPDGHEESIKQFRVMLSESKFRGRTELRVDDWQQVTLARLNRHVADYSPYDRQQSAQFGRGLETITGDDWREAAEHNIKWAARILTAAIKIVGE